MLKWATSYNNWFWMTGGLSSTQTQQSVTTLAYCAMIWAAEFLVLQTCFTSHESKLLRSIFIPSITFWIELTGLLALKAFMTTWASLSTQILPRLRSLARQMPSSLGHLSFYAFLYWLLLRLTRSYGRALFPTICN